MRLALLASILLFAGSIAGFDVASATGDGGGDTARVVKPGERQSEIILRDCPAGRRWEEA